MEHRFPNYFWDRTKCAVGLHSQRFSSCKGYPNMMIISKLYSHIFICMKIACKYPYEKWIYSKIRNNMPMNRSKLVLFFKTRKNIKLVAYNYSFSRSLNQCMIPYQIQTSIQVPPCQMSSNLCVLTLIAPDRTFQDRLSKNALVWGCRIYNDLKLNNCLCLELH